MEVESVEKPKIYFGGKVYCRGKTDMITAFFRGIRGSEGVDDCSCCNKDGI